MRSFSNFGMIHATGSKKRGGARLLSVLLTLALVLSLLPAVGLAAGAANWDFWTDVDTTALTAAYDTGWYGISPQPGATYSIDTAEKFAGLAAIVNSTTAKPAYYTKYDPETSANRFLTETGEWAHTLAEAKTLVYDNFNDDTVKLVSDIDLSGTDWYPIGGVSVINAGVPSGQFFAGVFDGYKDTAEPDVTTYNTHLISGVNVPFIDTTPVNNSGYGVFGYVNGGSLLNLSLAGDVDVEGHNVSAIGGLVGYTNGDLYNIHNAIDVSMTNSSASMLGAIAGTVENNNQEKTVYVQYCSNTGIATGRGRVGGIVGAVYCALPGGVVVDNCLNTAATINTIGSAINSYLGGIVGYCRGFITNCYTAGTTITTAGGHYQGGVAGLLQGSGSPQASMSNSYAAVSFSGSTSERYDHALFATVDDSDTLPIVDSLYDIDLAGIYTNEPGTGDNRWGWWTDSGTVETTDFTDYPNYGDATVYTSTGTSTTSTTMPVLAVLGGAYLPDNTGGTVINGGYPILAWQVKGVPKYDPTAQHGIYLNGQTGLDTNDGLTPGTAVETFAVAKGKLEPTRPDILITGTVDVTTNEGTWTLDSGHTVRRGIDNGVVFPDALVNLTTDPLASTTGEITLRSINIDGGADATPARAPLVTVNGGTLNIDMLGALRNNHNTQGEGGAIGLYSGTVNIEGGLIYGNVADRGAGVYYYGGTLNLAPAGPVTLTDAVYLVNGANSVITVSAPLTSLTDALSIQVRDPQYNTPVAQGTATYTLTDADVSLLSYAGGGGWFIMRDSENNLAVLRQEAGIFLDGASGDDSNTGARDNPVRTLDRALELLAGPGVIYVLDIVTVDSLVDDGRAATWQDVTVRRSVTNDDPLFEVTAGGELTLSYVTVDGNAGETYWNESSLINVKGGRLILNGAALTNNHAGEGSAVNVFTGTFEMRNGTITDQRAIRGGAVFVAGDGTFELSGGTISGNSADNTGGAVRVGGEENHLATFTMSGGEISRNRTGTGVGSGSGGGVSIMAYGAGEMTGGVIKGNTAQNNGGGVYVSPGGAFTLGGDATIGGTAPEDANIADAYGGGVCVDGQDDQVTTFTMSAGEILGNSSLDGGGVYMNSVGTFTLNSGVINRNTAQRNGGGVFGYMRSVFSQSGGTIGGNGPEDGNTAQRGGGGGIYLSGFIVAPSITGGDILGNKAVNGGGLYVDSPGSYFASHDFTVRDNTASGNGGGVYIGNGPSTWTNVTISGNRAANGGGMYLGAGGMHLSDGCLVSRNTAEATAAGVNAYGGGVYAANASDLYLEIGTVGTGSVIAGNTAASLGGASYGGGVYADTNADVYLNGGIIGNYDTIDGNTADYGGGVYLSENSSWGGVMSFTAGAIRGNRSTTGVGIYEPLNGKLTLAPSGAGSIIFGDRDDIYLPNPDGTTEGQVSFNITADLGTGAANQIRLTIPNPVVEGIVAIATTPAMAASSRPVLIPSGTIALSVFDEYIYILGTRLD